MYKNVVGWFEIPTLDLDRAQKFYEEVLGLKLERHTMGPLEMAWFPWIEDAAIELDRVEAAGGNRIAIHSLK